MATPDPRQQTLLDWTPPEAVRRFEEVSVRAHTIADRIARAVSQAMKDSTLSRDELAESMSDYLGEGQDVPKNMLDAYASQARTEHVIPIVRFIALLHATGDQRLLQMIAEMFGWAVIDRKYLPLIDLASIRAREDALKATRMEIERHARKSGAI